MGRGGFLRFGLPEANRVLEKLTQVPIQNVFELELIEKAISANFQRGISKCGWRINHQETERQQSSVKVRRNHPWLNHHSAFSESSESIISTARHACVSWPLQGPPFYPPFPKTGSRANTERRRLSLVASRPNQPVMIRGSYRQCADRNGALITTSHLIHWPRSLAWFALITQLWGISRRKAT